MLTVTPPPGCYIITLTVQAVGGSRRSQNSQQIWDWGTGLIHALVLTVMSLTF